MEPLGAIIVLNQMIQMKINRIIQWKHPKMIIVHILGPIQMLIDQRF